MTPDPVAWLTQEVRDLLDAGPVGLYEFRWLLRGAHPQMSETDQRTYAQASLDALLDAHAGTLTRLRWPDNDPCGHVARDGLPTDAWNEPTEGIEYIALAAA